MGNCCASKSKHIKAKDVPQALEKKGKKDQLKRLTIIHSIKRSRSHLKYDSQRGTSK